MNFSPVQKEWNQRCTSSPHAQFLQSYEWGIFQKALGRQVWYIGGGFGNEDVQCLVIQYPLAVGRYYFMCPRGPIGMPRDIWWQEFSTWAHDRGALFARIEPFSRLPSSAFARRVRDVQPAVTRIVDLTDTEQALLSAMHPKTRYNINLAQKKGVTITSTPFGAIDNDSIQDWLKLSQETAKRNHISTHPFDYYKTLFTTFPYISISTARLENVILAMTVDVRFGDTVYYLYGASSQERKEAMAPYLLQWHGMHTAKKDGYRYYDFWGVAPDDSTNHPLAGVTRFKKGFGGEVIAYQGTFDIPFQKIAYRFYTLVRSIRRSL